MSDKVRMIDEYCCMCGKQLNTWDRKSYKAFKMKPVCENCISKECFDISVDEFRNVMQEYFGLRPCKGI